MRHTTLHSGLRRHLLASALAFCTLALAATASAAPPACNPKSCNQLQAVCGFPSDTCGGTLSCGTCGAGTTCSSSYRCVCEPRTCAQLGYSCGSVDDGCGTALNCGGCGAGQTCSSASRSCVAACTPTTCAQLGATCGNPPDGCGGTLSCGTCGSGTSCNAAYACVCTPASCASLGAACGAPADGCGGTLNCGTCNGGRYCSSTNQCVNGSCSPTTCAALGATCGTPFDGCNGYLSCGSCGSGQTCNANNRCVTGCTAATCASLGAQCGSLSDGCGGTLSCGTCANPRTCDVSNRCVLGANCQPKTCADLGANCGSPSDGCGGTISCGSCSGGQSCSYGNVCVAATTIATVGANFPAGSLIIPMDQCYQKTDGSAAFAYNGANSCVAATAPTCYKGGSYPDGDIRGAFGLIYLLASNNIPVHVILRNDKTAMADADFTITPSGSQPASYALAFASGAYAIDTSRMTATSGNAFPYLGMPFVIEASFAPQALAVIAAHNAARANVFARVNLHVANYEFAAPVFATLATRPKPVGIGPDFGQITYFDESGITSVIPAGSSYVTVTGSGNSWSFTWPSADLGPLSACPGDVCSAFAPTIDGVPYRVIDTLWTGDADLQHYTELKTFLQQGGRVLAVNTAVTAWERPNTGERFLGGSAGLDGASRGAASGDFCPAMATTNGNAWPGPALNYPASDPYLQIGDLPMIPVGGGLSATWRFNGIPALNTNGLTSFDVDNQGNRSNYFVAIAGRPMINGVQAPGHVIYEGGGNAWHGQATNKDAGLHVMYNTLINSSADMINGWSGAEMTRSSPVGLLTGESYLGTFDWKIPPNPSAPGNVLWTPPIGTYPYLTGHFREYKPTATGVSSLAALCDASDASSPCNWDGANGIPAWANRRVYVGSGSGTTWTLTDAHTLTSDATINYIRTRLDVTVSGTARGLLGGIDYATGAVIESKPNGRVTVAGAAGRPTIAYVGARDGMLHAFCAKPEAGQTQCYGTYPVGTEIWALIPPGVKTQMDAARVAGDWSKVNVGGAVRVADVQDTFVAGQVAAYRTVLIAGTRESGHIFALDISNPSPTNLNADGLKLLWDNDGTRVNGGVQAYPMGGTHGVAMAVTGTSSPYAIATAAATGSSAGVNTYVLRMRDGVVMSSQQSLFTRRIPIAGGSSAAMPRTVPAMPTILDVGGTGVDNAVLVADTAGYVRKFAISSAGVLGSPSTMFDTAASRCASDQSCQPIGVSPSIARRGNALGVFVGTGGADWARGQSTMSRVIGFDAAATGLATAFFDTPLTTVFNPVAGGSTAVAAAMPVRVYSQLSISGTDIYALGTTLAVDTYNQLLLPTLRPGTYGQVYRWGNVDGTLDSNAFLLITQGQSFAGGVASALATNSTSGDGVLTLQGTSSVVRSSLVSTSLRNVSQNTSLAATARPYTAVGWFDLAE